jgi:hypothetical protein
MDVDYGDYSFRSYSKEDDKWCFPEKRTVNRTLGTTQTAEISIEAFYGDRLLIDSDNFSIYC